MHISPGKLSDLKRKSAQPELLAASCQLPKGGCVIKYQPLEHLLILFFLFIFLHSKQFKHLQITNRVFSLPHRERSSPIFLSSVDFSYLFKGIIQTRCAIWDSFFLCIKIWRLRFDCSHPILRYEIRLPYCAVHFTPSNPSQIPSSSFPEPYKYFFLFRCASSLLPEWPRDRPRTQSLRALTPVVPHRLLALILALSRSRDRTTPSDNGSGSLRVVFVPPFGPQLKSLFPGLTATCLETLEEGIAKGSGESVTVSPFFSLQFLKSALSAHFGDHILNLSTFIEKIVRGMCFSLLA